MCLFLRWASSCVCFATALDRILRLDIGRTGRPNQLASPRSGAGAPSHCHSILTCSVSHSSLAVAPMIYWARALLFELRIYSLGPPDPAVLPESTHQCRLTGSSARELRVTLTPASLAFSLSHSPLRAAALAARPQRWLRRRHCGNFTGLATVAELSSSASESIHSVPRIPAASNGCLSPDTDLRAGKLALLNCSSWQSQQGTFRALGTAGIEPRCPTQVATGPSFRLSQPRPGGSDAHPICNE